MNQRQQSDAELIKMIKEGDPATSQALQQIRQRCHDKVKIIFNKFPRLKQNHQLFEDIEQETLIKVTERIKKNEIRNLDAYWCTVFRNGCIKALKTIGRNRDNPV